MLAIGGAGVFALFSVPGKKYQYDQVVSVFIYFVTALDYTRKAEGHKCTSVHCAQSGLRAMQIARP